MVKSTAKMILKLKKTDTICLRVTLGMSNRPIVSSMSHIYMFSYDIYIYIFV